MAMATHPEKQAVGTATKFHATTEQVWREIQKASFAVVGYITPAGEARSSGVVYKTVGKRLYFAVAPESWKARHIAASKRVSVTVPAHRGGILALVAPIPPATISFHAAAIVHPAGSVKINSLARELESLLPPERRDTAVLIELIPEGRFLTYGVGVSLTDMRKPELAEAVVPVSN
jgi:pyridoxamine 5'-phosphate oxidase-like protein